MRISRIAALFLLAAILGACKAVQPTPNVILVTPSAPPSATSFSSPLATPLSPLATPFSSPVATASAPAASAGQTAPAPAAGQTTPGPKPAAGSATITGYLIQGTSSPKPAVGIIVGLAAIVPDASGKGALAGYDPVTSPRFITDDTGHFVFPNIQPGSYALILDRVLESYMLNDPKTGGDMVFTVKAGQVLDVGRLQYDELPGATPAP